MHHVDRRACALLALSAAFSGCVADVPDGPGEIAIRKAQPIQGGTVDQTDNAVTQLCALDAPESPD